MADRTQQNLNISKQINSITTDRFAKDGLGFNTQLTDLKQLEGECKIQHVRYMKFSYLKTILLGIPLMLTVVGLFLIKYFKSLRALVFYSEESQQNNITNVFIEGVDDIQEIAKVKKIIFQQKQRIVFKFNGLAYEIIDMQFLPIGMHFSTQINQYMKIDLMRVGLSDEQADELRTYYGSNEHNVNIPNYFIYLFDTMTGPFFILQYLNTVILIFENVATFGILMVCFSFITTTINYILLYISFTKIKKNTEKTITVNVLRSGSFREVSNKEMVPGDIYRPAGQVPCDSIILMGELFTNEVSMTGENVPIGKFQLLDPGQVHKQNHWIYEGSTVLTSKAETLALVVNTGFTSTKGRIIRKILTNTTKTPDFIQKSVFFLIETLVVSWVIFGATYFQYAHLQIDQIMIIFRFCDFATYSIPSAFPIFFNLAYSFCLIRLNGQNVGGTEPQKTVEGARIETMCFDKTGTLTQTSVQVSKIIAVETNGSDIRNITASLADKVNELTRQIFASCHCVQIVNGQHMGDEIDLRMFLFSKYSIEASEATGIITNISNEHQNVEVLKINQYESRFQSMSVIVRQTHSKKIYIFAKGAPEMIHNYSTLKYLHFEEKIKEFSLKGLRTIAFSYKEIMPSQLNSYITLDRSKFLDKTIMIGMVAFENKLKSDTRQMIQTLKTANINSKVITGDNIFVAVQIAMLSGIISDYERVVVIEGKQVQTRFDQRNSIQPYNCTLLSKKDGEIMDEKIMISSITQDTDPDIVFAIDNDFINKNQDFQLCTNMRIFARISPQNKALIVKKHKKVIVQEYEARSWLRKLFGSCSKKVGMCGDGANDLIAIREANLGIGISNSDAVYGASFTIQNLMQIPLIIREAKSMQRQIMEMVQYYATTNYMRLILAVLLTSQATFFQSAQSFYYNFLLSLSFTLCMGFNKPADTLTHHSNRSNFMGWENQLVYWGHLTIATGTFAFGYFYYVSSSDFTSNPKLVVELGKGWNSNTKVCTIIFQMLIFIYLVSPVAISRSLPIKQRIWTNIPMTLLFIVNSILTILIFLFTSSGHLGFLGLLSVDQALEGVIVIILCVGTVIMFLYHKIIEYISLIVDERQAKQQKARIMKKISIND